MQREHPVCYIIAGPNGAGKTTYALRFLPAIAACRNFINADEIARGISPLDISSGMITASKIFLKQLAEKIKKREDFAFETTLSGKNYLSKIKQWRKNNWQVVLVYLYIPSPEFSESRVKQRVAQGGHDIPTDAIFRRYPRSIKNLFEYAKICDQTICFNNTESESSLIFEQRFNHPPRIINQQIYSSLQEVCKYED